MFDEFLNLIFLSRNFEQDSRDEMGCSKKSKMYHSRVGQPQEKAVFLNASMSLH